MPSYVSEPSDERIILRFNYTETREYYDNYYQVGGKLSETPIGVSDLNKFIDSNGKPVTGADGCKLGDYH